MVKEGGLSLSGCPMVARGAAATLPRFLPVLVLLASASGFVAIAADSASHPTRETGRGNGVTYRAPRLSDFYLELVVVGVLAAYIFHYSRGKAKNKRLASTWASAHSSVLSENFAHVGDNVGNLLTSEGATDYFVYASGRRYCEYAFVKLKLLPRQDLLEMLYRVFSPTQDKVTIEVALDPEQTEDFVFAILPRKKALSIKKSRWDIENFTRQYSAEGLPETHVCLSEGAELVDSILSGPLLAAIRSAGGRFEELIITDQPTEKPTSKQPAKKTLTLKFNLCTGLVDDSGFLRAAFELIDVIAENAKLRPETRARGKKTRDEVWKELEKEEMRDRLATRQQQKAEERRKELEKVSRMTPELQRKWEEKERKKDLKKQMKQRMKLIK